MSHRLTAPIYAGAVERRVHIPGRIELRALSGDAARAATYDHELLIYGDIGDSWYGDSVSAETVIDQLRNLRASHILVRINSYGGSVTDGTAIYNAVRATGAAITTRVEGIAASIASLIAMAGDTRQMFANTLLMLHAPWTISAGNSVDMRRLADDLDRYAAAMASSYARATGRSESDELALLTDGVDHWFSAVEARDSQYVTEIVDDSADAGEQQARLSTIAAAMSRYRSAPAQLLARSGLHRLAPPTPSLPAAVAASQSAAQHQEFHMWTALARALGVQIDADADDDAVRAAIALHLRLAADATDDEISAAVDATRSPRGPPAPANPAAPPAQPGASREDRIKALWRTVVDSDRNRRDDRALSDLRADCLLDPDCDEDEARRRLRAALGNGAEPVAGHYAPDLTQARLPHTASGRDARDGLIQGATRALEARAGIAQREAGNEYNGLSLTDIAAACLSVTGVRVRGMSKDQLARKVLAAMSTSDFPLITSNVAGRVLQAAYESFPHTYNRFCLVGEVSDFKAVSRIQMGSFNSLDLIPEGGEYTFGETAETGEGIQAATKGKALRLTRQLLVNDDLGAFTRRAQLLGRAAGRTVNSDAYGLLTSGAGANGPTMSDGGQLFNSTAPTYAGTPPAPGAGHGNLASTGAAVSVASISAGRAAMRKQRDVTLRDTLNLSPSIILAPVAIEDTIWAVLNSTADPASANSAKANYVRDVANLELITDPYLDGISTTAWYLLANPMDAALIEVDFLDGQQTPFIDEDVEFLTDALVMKVRLDYGLSAIEYRAGYKNPGA